MKLIDFLRNRLYRLYNEDTVRISRNNFIHRELKNNEYTSKPLTKEQKLEIQSFWSQYTSLDKDAWKWFEVYNSVKPKGAILKYYIPDNIYYTKVDMHFSNQRECLTFDDKNMYDLYFPNVKMPETVSRKIGGVFLDHNYSILEKNDVLSLCKRYKSLILKISKGSDGGHGVFFLNTKESSNGVLADILEGNRDFVIQRIVSQHREISKIHDKSINTIRIMSLFFNNQVRIVSSVLRMGVNDSRLDNAHSGGIVSGILPDGRLRDVAYNIRGKRFDRHPQGTQFGSIVVPSLERCHNIVKSQALRFIGLSRLISWDFAIDENGAPVLIEVNLTYGGVDVHQMSNGPVFGEMTEAVLNEVFKKGNNK